MNTVDARKGRTKGTAACRLLMIIYHGLGRKMTTEDPGAIREPGVRIRLTVRQKWLNMWMVPVLQLSSQVGRAFEIHNSRQQKKTKDTVAMENVDLSNGRCLRSGSLYFIRRCASP